MSLYLIADVEKLAEEYPADFEIKKPRARISLMNGDMARLIFILEDGGYDYIWVRVLSRRASQSGLVYEGDLKKDPSSCASSLRAGSIVIFETKNVFDFVKTNMRK